MPFASIRGQRLFYEDTGGPGPAVLLSHGFMMDRTMFAPQVAALAPRFRVVTWDQRGFGDTDFDGQPFTYWDSAADALGLLDHLGIDRAAFGGMSQGGFLSLRAALLAPDRVSALALFSTQAGVDPPHVLESYRQMMTTWLAMGPIDPLIEGIAQIILGPPEHWEPWLSRWRTLPKERLRQPATALLDRDDITARLGEITAPALLFHGTADHAIPMERAEALATNLPGSKGLVKLEGAAHAANLTHSAQANPPLLDFLNTVFPNAAR